MRRPVTFDFVMTINGYIPRKQALHVSELSLDHKRRTTPNGAGIIASTEIFLEIAENPAIFRTQNRSIRKTFRETPQPAPITQ